MAVPKAKDPRLHWAWNSYRLEALIEHIEGKAYDIYKEELGVDRAAYYGIDTDGNIAGTTKPPPMPPYRALANAYNLAECLQSKGISVSRRALVAGDWLFLILEFRIALKRKDADEAAQILSSLWINTTYEGLIVDLSPVVSKLLERDKIAKAGASSGGVRTARKYKDRDQKIRQYIEDQLCRGKEYRIVVALMARNWPPELGGKLSEQTIRNTFPKKTFPTAPPVGKK